MNKSLILFLFCGLLSTSLSLYVGDSIEEPSDVKTFVQKSYYVITTPKVWMSSEESVCLVLLKELSLTNPVLNVKISSINTKEIFTQKYLAFNSYSKCIQIETQEIRAERALLTVQLSDLIYETLEIRVKPSNGLTLIETSKPIYRPSERLQFRVIAVNDWLRPIDEQFRAISIENSRAVPVMQWTNVNTTNGMLALDMPIADDNHSGIWKIKTISHKNIVTEKIFNVYDYETPNILISIDSQNYIQSSDEQSVNRVCVRNSFGQSLKGKIRAFVSYIKFNWERLNMLQHLTTPYIMDEFEINGCYDLVLNSSKLLWDSPKYGQRSLKVSLQYTDERNGFIEEKFIEIPVVDHKLIVSFPSIKLMKQYFKPSLPYFGHVMVHRPDYTPASEEPLNICYQSRDTPWLASEGYVCKQMVSNTEGMVDFIIPPMSESLKQIEIRVKSIKYPSIESRMILEPSYTPTHEYMTVRPLIDNNNCNEFIDFSVLFNKPILQKKIFYQVIGQGLTHEPQVYTIDKLNPWSDQNMISNAINSYPVYVANMRFRLPVQSALNNNLINRILLYYLDSNNDLIADSTVFLSTCADQSQHSTQISLQKDNFGNDIKLRLNTRPNSTCALRLAQNKPYNSLKRINQFVEKFNIRQESSARDRCEKAYNLRKIESESYTQYNAPYGFDTMSRQYDPVINYGDAWDSFNDIGLLVTSNAKLDESPCDWDLYPRDILSQLSELRANQMQYLSKNRFKSVVRSEIQDIEKSLLNEVFDWNLVNTDSNTIIDRRISHDLISNSGQLYADTVCVNKDFGITYARNVFNKHSLSDRPFTLSVIAPKESRIGDSLQYKVIVERSSAQEHNCLPIEFQFESSESYQLIGAPKHMCFCGTTSQPLSMFLKPQNVGLINVKLVAKYPKVFSEDILNSNCAQIKSTGFEPQIITRQLSVSPLGIVSKQANHQIICNNNNNNENNKIQDLSQHMRDSTDMIVTNELLEPMYRHIKGLVSHNSHNCLDSLSAFATSYYLYSYSKNMSDDWVHKNELTHELTKSFQLLMNYRHTDGSYSLMKSRKHNSDIGLTVSVFKVLAQSKPYLSFVETGNRVNRLKDTLDWIFSQQSDDGCFPLRSSGHSNQWPISFDDNYELTGYVLSSLLETGLDYSVRPLKKAYNCLSQKSKHFMANIDSKPLSAIFYTYIQTLNGNTDESDVWLQSLNKALNNLESNDLLNREMLSYIGLSYYLSNDFNAAKNIGQKLIQSERLWQTPISCYAITRLWPLLKHKTSTAVKVFEDNDHMVSTLLLNETHSHHNLNGYKIAVPNNGCLLVASNRVKTQLSTQSTNFEIKIDGLDKGFMACNRRRIRYCVTERNGVSVEQPVVRIQLTTGFELDKKLMKKIIDNQVVVKYRKIGSEYLVFLHPFTTRDQSYCFIVPVLQRDDNIYDNSKAFVKVYDYYNEDINDVMTYQLPNQCHIESDIVGLNN